jgi:hypothetical protein
VTHSNNMEQRYVPVPFTAASGTLTVTAPANANIAPPGDYMLFLVNSAGVPSVAPIVNVAPPAGPQPNPPTVTNLNPNRGPVGGGTSVSITGTILTGATAVSFGSIAATSFKVNSSTSLTAISPAETTGTVEVTVTTPAGTSGVSTADRFKFAPTITGLSPNTGSEAGGTSLTVSGTGFALGETATIFRFGSTKATSVNCTSTTTCTIVSPAHAAGTVGVNATANKVSSAKVPAARFTFN